MWLADASADLVDAVDLLGGPLWLPTAFQVIHAAEHGNDLGSVLPHLRRLRRLLHLDYVTDLSSEPARRFLTVDPDHPRADNARLCAEAIDRGILAVEQVRAVRRAEAA